MITADVNGIQIVDDIDSLEFYNNLLLWIHSEDYDNDSNCPYEYIQVSVFDDYLINKSDGSEEITHYYGSENEKEMNKYLSHEKKLLKFYYSLNENFSVYLLLEGLDKALLGSIVKVSKDKYEEFIIENIRSEAQGMVLIKELDIIIKGGYDLTHRVYFKNQNIEIANKIKDIINYSNLFILPPHLT